MESFERFHFDDELYGYFKTQKLSNHQTISIFFVEEHRSRAKEYNVLLAIANKKKHIREWVTGQRDLLEDKTTGRCGLEGLLWAKRQIIAFEEFISSRHKEVVINVCWLDNRRKRVYEYGLGKIGYKMGFRDNQKCLFKKIS